MLKTKSQRKTLRVSQGHIAWFQVSAYGMSNVNSHPQQGQEFCKPCYDYFALCDGGETMPFIMPDHTPNGIYTSAGILAQTHGVDDGV